VQGASLAVLTSAPAMTVALIKTYSRRLLSPQMLSPDAHNRDCPKSITAGNPCRFGAQQKAKRLQCEYKLKGARSGDSDHVGALSPLRG
jgi:hypothetical protein